jgi:hypothetical protein
LTTDQKVSGLNPDGVTLIKSLPLSVRLFCWLSMSSTYTPIANNQLLFQYCFSFSNNIKNY